MLTQITVALIVGFMVAQIANLVTTVYLHRALTHRALTLHRIPLMAFKVVNWITTGIKVREWVAVHRKHHAKTDVPGDPHSPKLLGWFRVLVTNPYLYRREARNGETVRRYAKDLPRTTMDKLFFDWALVGLSIGIGILVVGFYSVGWPYWLGFVAAASHTVWYLVIGGLVNGICHWFGDRPYDNSATNLRWVAWLSGGEGYHNNHHAVPTSAKIGIHEGEVDFGWWLIAGLRRLGLAQIRLNVADATPEAQAA